MRPGIIPADCGEEASVKIEAFLPPTRLERLKYEVAEELGLMPKVMEVGWPGLTTAESGRVGGIVARKLRRERAEAGAAKQQE